MWTHSLFACCFMLALGCASAAPPLESGPLSSAANQAQAQKTEPSDGTAPRPFTAEQIRQAMPVGHQIRLKIEQEGKPAMIEHWTVTAADAQSCTIASKVYAEDGKLIEDQGSGTSKWTELREHAAFPAEATTLREGQVEVPAGKFEVVVYEVKRKNKEGAEQLLRFHFAKTLPGPPVLMVTEQQGREVGRMTLLERK